MISEHNIASVVGSHVTDNDGNKIGTVGQVYVDPTSGQPNWATVKTGLFGTKESFVPLDQANLTGGELRVPFTKDIVKDAPRIDSDSELTDAEQDDLYSYYRGFGSGERSTTGTGGGEARDTGVRDTGVRDTEARDTEARDAEARGTSSGVNTASGHDTSGPTTDDAMTRSEEQLNVGTERVEAGRARLRKYVVTEHETVTVPVEREEVRLEREPITDANVDDALDGPAISEEEHEVVLTEERPVVEKEAVPVERVRLGTETVSDTERVDADVRKEEIELEGDERRDV